MHGMKHTAPSRARRQVRECIEYPYQPRPERAFPGVVVALSFDRPIDQERPPHNGVAVHEAPEAAVPALIAIIPHCEILPGRHNNFYALHKLSHFLRPLRLKLRRNHLAWGRSEEHTSELQSLT